MQENIILYDKDIREPLFSFLEQQYGKIRILEEIRITKSRADIIMLLPDGVVGIEIKSDADTYARLAGQTKDYDRYFDYNYVVVGSTHAAHIEEHVPAHWGIITVEPVDEEIDFYVLRKPHLNIKMEMEKKLELLWRPELVHIQQQTQMPAYKERSKAFVREKIIEKVPAPVLQQLISQELFERDYTTILEEINAFRAANHQKPRRSTRKRRKKLRPSE